jgi:hypothetical protein
MFTDICQSRKIWASRTSCCSRRGNLMRAMRETRTNRTRCSLMHGVRRIWASQTRYRSRRTGMMHGMREGGWIMFGHSSTPIRKTKTYYAWRPAVHNDHRCLGLSNCGRIDIPFPFIDSPHEPSSCTSCACRASVCRPDGLLAVGTSLRVESAS